MTTQRLALLSFTGGSCFALGIMGAFAARSFYTVAAAHRWGDVRRLLGVQ